jgi:hypothetical protein
LLIEAKSGKCESLKLLHIRRVTTPPSGPSKGAGFLCRGVISIYDWSKRPTLFC